MINKLFIPIFFLMSCSDFEPKYRIESIVETKEGPKYEILYTKTINFDGDTIYYFNNEGDEVRIYPPYTLKHLVNGK
jgi:hypothetical protein